VAVGVGLEKSMDGYPAPLQGKKWPHGDSRPGGRLVRDPEGFRRLFGLVTYSAGPVGLVCSGRNPVCIFFLYCRVKTAAL
jgi:hypothetical protein